MEDCVSFREGLYCPNRLQSFQEIIGDPYFHLPFFAQQSLGYEGSFLAGTDIVGLGWAGSGGEILQDQAISSFAYTQPWLAMGLLGLSDQPLNISGPTDLHPSPLGTLLNSERVPSSFWAYNAGARYLDPLVYGRLTFGGFDAARGDVKKGLKVPLGLDNFRDTVVKVTDMTLRVGSDATEAVSIAFDAYIDSVVPELWLPASACSAFESAFSLEWDASAQLYLVDDVLNQALHDQGAEVTLTIADPADLDQNINIHFPYAAFDIEAKYPLAGITDDSTLRYFPLKRANNSDQYTLGRTFLQEACENL